MDDTVHCAAPAAEPTANAIDTRLAALERDHALLLAEVAAGRSAQSRMRRQVRVTWALAAAGCLGSFALGGNPEARAQVGVSLASLAARMTAVETKTQTITYVATGHGHPHGPTGLFTGVNVQIVNGAGSTSGNPDDPAGLLGSSGTTNGLGNLIIGYNENPETTAGVDRTGSHNLIVGGGHQYSSYGGAVFGIENSISGPGAAITGGVENTASAGGTSVSGGQGNTASGPYASVSGGQSNIAGRFDTALADGGQYVGKWSSISGGAQNEIDGLQEEFCSISGGFHGDVSDGFASSISGGFDNSVIDDQASSIGGGEDCSLNGDHAFEAAGTVFVN